MGMWIYPDMVKTTSPKQVRVWLDFKMIGDAVIEEKAG
jgi:hypothetical protein